MQLKQISSWKTFDSIHKDVEDEYVKSWLLEKGPITTISIFSKSIYPSAIVPSRRPSNAGHNKR
jgi:ferric iron reductase protein FhuF